MRDEKGRFLKGTHPSTGNEFKKGFIPWNKGKKGIFSGEKNSFYGRHHKKESMIKISGPNHWNWKGGKRIQDGYVLILKHDHPYSDRDGYVREAKLVAEKELGRYLKPEERTHHRNAKKDDNRWDNLFVFENNSEHSKYERFLRRK